MKYFLAFCLVVGVASAAYVGSQDDPETYLQPQQRRINLSGSTKQLIEKLLDSMHKLAEEAREAIHSFGTGVQHEATHIRERISTDIQRLSGRVATAINDVSDKLIDSGVGIVGCVSTSREEAAVLFNETVTKALACVNDRVKDVTEQISGLSSIVTDTVTFSNQVVEDMNQCTKDNGNILSVGACLGNVALHAEMKAAMYATHSAVTIGRISLSLATLPAALEVCAGTRLVEAGISTTRIIVEIGSCSASAVYASMSGSNTENPESALIPDQLSTELNLLRTNVGSLPMLFSNQPAILRQ